MESKKEIRKRLLGIRDLLSYEENKAKSQKIFERLTEMKEYKEAKKVLIFISYKSEVDTSFALKKCISDDKKIYAPRVCGDDMRFFEIKGYQDVKEGYKGIFEPDINEKKEYQTDYASDYDGSDLIIMPAAVLDEAGNRIGYGKGFYDRYLNKSFRGEKIAVIFDFGLVRANSFETDVNDVRPDYIITESKCIKV